MADANVGNLIDNQIVFSKKLGLKRIHVAAFQDTEIIVSQDKVASVKRWLDS